VVVRAPGEYAEMAENAAARGNRSGSENIEEAKVYASLAFASVLEDINSSIAYLAREVGNLSGSR
jgi:hypothetical protein